MFRPPLTPGDDIAGARPAGFGSLHLGFWEAVDRAVFGLFSPDFSQKLNEMIMVNTMVLSKEWSHFFGHVMKCIEMSDSTKQVIRCLTCNCGLDLVSREWRSRPSSWKCTGKPWQHGFFFDLSFRFFSKCILSKNYWLTLEDGWFFLEIRWNQVFLQKTHCFSPCESLNHDESGIPTWIILGSSFLSPKKQQDWRSSACSSQPGAPRGSHMVSSVGVHGGMLALPPRVRFYQSQKDSSDSSDSSPSNFF